MKFIRRYNFNHSFFATPTVLNSYYAGFIAADGYIHEERKVMTVQINQQDRIFLENIKKDTFHEGKILGPYKDDIIRLDFNCSQQICQDLKNSFNITGRKTFTLQPPKIQDELALAYIIGYIDGDGSICNARTKYWSKKDLNFRTSYWISLQITGTKNLLNWIKLIFDAMEPYGKYGMANVYLRKENTKGQKIYSYRLGGQRALRVLRRLKNISVPKLDRKWSKVS